MLEKYTFHLNTVMVMICWPKGQDLYQNIGYISPFFLCFHNSSSEGNITKCGFKSKISYSVLCVKKRNVMNYDFFKNQQNLSVHVLSIYIQP